MQINLNEKDREFVETMAVYLGKPPDVVVSGVISFFIHKGLALIELGDAITHEMGKPEQAKAA